MYKMNKSQAILLGLKCQAATHTHTPVSGSPLPHHGNRQGPHLPSGFYIL